MLNEQRSGLRNEKGQFLQGFTGNPAGRPRGSRNKLGEAFLETLAADFDAHGAEAIAECRLTNPTAYIRIVASLLPEKLETTAPVVEQPDMTQEKIEATVRRLLEEV